MTTRLGRGNHQRLLGTVLLLVVWAAGMAALASAARADTVPLARSAEHRSDNVREAGTARATSSPSTTVRTEAIANDERTHR